MPARLLRHSSQSLASLQSNWDGSIRAGCHFTLWAGSRAGFCFKTWRSSADRIGKVRGRRAWDLRVTFEGFVERGFSNTEDQAARFAALLGRQPRTYSSFAEELAREWAAA